MTLSMPEITIKRTSGDLRISDDGTITAFTEWSVVAPSPIDAVSAVFRIEGVTRGSVYQSPQGQILTPQCLCRDIQCRPNNAAPIGGYGEFWVRADFSTQSRGRAGNNPKKPEPGKPAVWTVETEYEEEPYEFDFEMNPLQNANEEPIDPAPTRLKCSEILVARYYVSNSTQLAMNSLLRPYRNKVNKLTFKGVPKGCLLLKQADPVQEEDGEILITLKWLYQEPYTPAGSATYVGLPNYSPLSAPFEGHAVCYPHRGFRRRAAGTAPEQKYRRIKEKDDNGEETKTNISQPVNLDRFGATQSSGRTVLVVYPYKYIDHNLIPIP